MTPIPPFLLRLFVLSTILLHQKTAASRDKQINLEDIERDNLLSERRTKETSSTQYLSPPPPPAPEESPKVNFGFIPHANDKPAEPTYNYHQYLPQQPQHPQLEQPYEIQPQQQQYYLTEQFPKHTEAVFHSNAQQQPVAYQQYPSGEEQQYLQYHQPQIQYVVDNSIANANSGHQPQYFYQPQQYQQQQQQVIPQIIYNLQPQYQGSDNIHSVVDTKGVNIQYVMLVPSADYGANEQQQIPETHQAKAPEVHYATTRPQIEQYSHQQRREPTSLLDSYVPSYLQYQYYQKQQQQQQQQQHLFSNNNAIDKHPAKVSIAPEQFAKTYVKQYKN